ncbi:DnaJ domain protein [Ancylostoma duodenale]|uniref:DnaJ domain protein n=1 Tax=Ancylostoma duodenale TaxID=51022 RepID=A0A0C2G0R3_9BILA|nr:DnaJ domain protein [Ancylostoma duodenale]
MSRRLLVSCGFNSFPSRVFSSHSNVDHYAVLGLKPGATLKVSLAYEVLGSDEKRRAYDLTRIRTAPDLGLVFKEVLCTRKSLDHTKFSIQFYCYATLVL